MAEQAVQEAAQCEAVDSEEEDLTPGYKAPAKKNLSEIVTQDQEDESLNKYKKALLGEFEPSSAPFPDDPRNVIVTKMSLVVQDRPDIELDLTGKLEEIKKTKIVLKEGVQYRIKMSFYIQRDIVSGLRYFHKVSRKGISVDKTTYMIGSFGPSKEEKSITSKEEEEAPKGMIARGDYVVKSKFIDDDKNSILEWEWHLTIKKDWED